MNELTQARFKSLVSYDINTGEFRWKCFQGAGKSGSVAGCVKNRGYMCIGIDNKVYQAHRLAFLYMTGSFPEHFCDHINGDKTDNRWVNLRAVSRVDNARNQRIPNTNTSGVIGVSWDKRKLMWRAQITILKKIKHIGYFHSLDEASCARSAAQKSYGFHDNHGRCP